jgi:hypothetical protein
MAKVSGFNSSGGSPHFASEAEWRQQMTIEGVKLGLKPKILLVGLPEDAHAIPDYSDASRYSRSASRTGADREFMDDLRRSQLHGHGILLLHAAEQQAKYGDWDALQ